MTEQNAAIVWAMTAVSALVECGLTDIVVSPGSRSTPLVTAVCDDGRLRDHGVIDERSAAFVALGIAQATGRPVAVLCTSGTAAANYFPAVCEANHHRVPLIVLTADRPPRLRDSGASQSMRQVAMFGDHVRWAHDLGLPSADAGELRYVRATAQRAYAIARDEQGPVHLNFPFDKPLDPTAPPSRSAKVEATAVYQPLLRVPDPHAVTALVRRIEAAARPIFVVGSSRTAPRWAHLLVEVARRVGAPILAEATSQLRFGELADEIVAPDLVVAQRERADALRPDLVVQLGRAPLNWPMIRWLDCFDGARVIISEDRACDPDATAEMIFIGDEHRTLDALRQRLPESNAPAQWRLEFAQHGQRAMAHVKKAMADAPLVDASVAHDLAVALPDGAALVLSSSMPLREFETFAPPRKEALTVVCNRGLNGIDGVVSTAFGVAISHDGPTVLLIGDVAMSHDLAALQLAGRLGAKLTAVIVDNGGGAIFDHLPIAASSGRDTMFERHFSTAPGLNWEGAAQLFGVKVTAVSERSAFVPTLLESLDAPGVHLIVVRTDRAEAKAFRDTVVRTFGAV